jgi:hypothetical protein
MLVTNNLSVYKTPYTFLKVFTSLIANDSSAYVNVKGPATGMKQAVKNRGVLA